MKCTSLLIVRSKIGVKLIPEKTFFISGYHLLQVFTFNEVDYSSGQILVDEVYKISNSSDLIRQAIILYTLLPFWLQSLSRLPFGSWNSTERLKTSDVPHWERRKDLRGHKFRFECLKHKIWATKRHSPHHTRAQTVSGPPFVVVNMEGLVKGEVSDRCSYWNCWKTFNISSMQ